MVLKRNIVLSLPPNQQIWNELKGRQETGRREMLETHSDLGPQRKHGQLQTSRYSIMHLTFGHQLATIAGVSFASFN